MQQGGKLGFYNTSWQDSTRAKWFCVEGDLPSNKWISMFKVLLQHSWVVRQD